LNRKKNLYFSVNHISKYGNANLLGKAGILLGVSFAAYAFIFYATTYYQLQIAYIFLGTSWLIMGMNFGHDAAHNCLSGSKPVDNAVFQLLFGLQGINGYLWRIRHNHSHHPFPNVHEYDSDLEATSLLYLSTDQQKRKMHYYQHLYAPILYMFISLLWIFYIDFRLFRKKSLANMVSISHPKVELVKMVAFKVSSLTIFLVLPLLFSSLPAVWILFSFLVMQFLLSMMLAFIFFVSHHVCETSFSPANAGTIEHSWVEQQVSATLDFHGESRVANFIFGGFNAHLAHHMFPDVCHIHYPVLTTLIKRTLKDHNVKYNSLSFLQAIRSHLVHLKNLPRKTPVAS
jgi:linoleoyl-CoA desaturase